MKTIFVTALLLALAAPVSASPTVQVFGGRTSVELSGDFVGALNKLHVRPGAIYPAYLYRGKASFPIPGGALDLETAAGDIFHLGGLTLSADGTKVALLNFVIDTTGDPVLTGLVSVDGDVLGRVPLFDLDLSEASIRVKRRYLSIRGVGLTLSEEAAGALNFVFGVDNFVEGLDIGEADVSTRIGRRKFYGKDD